MLEKMGEFFDSRLDGYDEHMLNDIEDSRIFYPFTASLLPKEAGAIVLDLGCGTGLELEYYFKINPSAKVAGVDLAPGMLKKAEEKFKGKDLTLILASYFDVDFGENVFDGAASVESLHHYTKEQKIKLYQKLYTSLKEGGYFILTDYFAQSDEQEKAFSAEATRLKEAQSASPDEFYHFDCPLTVDHEKKALYESGFSSVEIVGNWGATYALKASK